jgi:hypothetical protein
VDTYPFLVASVLGDTVRWAVFVVAMPIIALAWYQLLRKMGSF